MNSGDLTIAEWVARAADRLESAGIESSKLEAQVLLAHVLGESRSWIMAHGDDELHAEGIHDVSAEILLQRRLAREPLAYLTGRREFFGRDFRVTPDVLIPRQETECLIDTVLNLLELAPQIEHCLELGVGSGCIAVTLAVETQLWVSGSDVSEAALQVAQANAEAWKARIRLRQGTWFEPWSGELFDLFVSNPPYISVGENLMPEVADYEPKIALFGGDDGLDCYRDLASRAPGFANPNAWFVVEIGLGQSADVQIIFESHGWEWIRTVSDLSRIERVMVFRLM